MADPAPPAPSPSAETADAAPGGRPRVAIGVDIGGSGIKAALVDLAAGRFVGERHRVVTPMPATPEAVIRTAARLVRRLAREHGLDGTVPVGVGCPAVVLDGRTMTAANVDPAWIGFDAEPALAAATGRRVSVVNDADAAGVAEMRFGAGRDEPGTVLVITLGTGTGSALFWNSVLVPNLELGHMEIRGRDAEKRSAAAARTRRSLSWKAWATDLDEHLGAIERLFWPRLFIIGGGVSKRSERFLPRLTTRARIVPAQLLNDAGIIGAAVVASERAQAEALAREPVSAEVAASGAAVPDPSDPDARAVHRVEPVAEGGAAPRAAAGPTAAARAARPRSRRPRTPRSSSSRPTGDA